MTIDTKYSIGDVAYIEDYMTILPIKIEHIGVKITGEHVSFEYNGYSEYEVFPSREALIKHRIEYYESELKRGHE